MGYHCDEAGNDNFESVIKMYKRYLKYLESESNEDYEVNEEQYHKLLRTVGFFSSQVRNSDNIEIEASEPKQLHCGVTVYATVFDFSRGDLGRLADVIKDVSALSIDATIDGDVCISMTIPDVWVRK